MGFVNQTVYYWRIAPVPSQGANYFWNNASFVFLKDSGDGFNQSHYYQYVKNSFERLQLDSSSYRFNFGSRLNTIYFRNGVYPYSGVADADFAVSLNDQLTMNSACLGNSLIFHVIDPVTFKPWKNVDSLGKLCWKS
jgi:hypothetical protein